MLCCNWVVFLSKMTHNQQNLRIKKIYMVKKRLETGYCSHK